MEESAQTLLRRLFRDMPDLRRPGKIAHALHDILVITAIRKLLEMLQFKDATVTIDAMGCQRDIAQKIIDRDGHYVLALRSFKGNSDEKST